MFLTPSLSFLLMAVTQRTSMQARSSLLRSSPSRGSAFVSVLPATNGSSTSGSDIDTVPGICNMRCRKRLGERHFLMAFCHYLSLAVCSGRGNFVESFFDLPELFCLSANIINLICCTSFSCFLNRQTCSDYPSNR